MTPPEESILQMEKRKSGRKDSFDVQFVGKCSLETGESEQLIHFLDLIILESLNEQAATTLLLQQELALMATDRDFNECGLGILDAIVKRKNSRAVLCPHETALKRVHIQPCCSLKKCFYLYTSLRRVHIWLCVCFICKIAILLHFSVSPLI